MTGRISCPSCLSPVPPERVNVGGLLPCPGCRTAIQIDLFPAWNRPIEAGSAGRDVTHAAESACFYHPEKQAVVPCEACGRFLCSLCDVVLGERHLCPNCIDSGRRQGKLAAVENKRTLHDRLAMMYAFWALLAWPFTLVTAPYALYLCFRHYNSPGSFVRPGKWRFWLAGIAAGLQVIAWLILFVMLIGQNF